MLHEIPDEWGPKAEYNQAAVTRTHTGPGSISLRAANHMALVMLSVQPERQVMLNSSRQQTGVAPVGTLEIVPADSEFYARWPVEKQNLLVMLDDGRLRGLAGAELDDDQFALYPPGFGTVDDDALVIARRLRYELERPELGSAESLDALVTLFSIHLLRRYSSLADRRERVHQGGLSPLAWRRLQDFIQSGLEGPLPLERMAQVAGLSPSHFVRAFRRTTGESPHRYITAARLARARELITGSEASMAEIARLAGFSSNSHMAAIMSREWGISPRQLRREFAARTRPEP